MRWRMEIGRAMGLAALAGAMALVCSPPPACAGTAVYGGGGYDGWDRNAKQQALGLPVVNNAAGATNILNTSAWLNGTLVDTGTAVTAVSVYWGPTDGVTNKANWTNRCDFGNCAAGQPLTTNLIGLAQGTPYYYRFYATNTAGDDAWADASAGFATFSAPTVTTNTGATSIGPRTATLNGIVTAGGSATVTFYWGQNSNNWSGSMNIGSCAQGTPFSTAVSGLLQGTLYYYQCYGTNAYGYGWSAVASFTTTLAPALFGGGSYDGYDRLAAQATMQTTGQGTVITIR
jgi:hypothetical protein